MEKCATDRGRRKRPHHGASRLALCGLALLVACAAPKPQGPLLLHPVPPAADNYALVQGAIVFTGPEFVVSARPWDYRLVAQEFARSGEASPFGKGEEATGRFLFLRVRLENRSSRALVFNPMRAELLPEGKAPLVPLENSDLAIFMGEDLIGSEARAKAFRRTSFDLTATVRPGETLERYLVFPAPEEAPKVMTLTLDELWLGSTSFDLRFGFEAYPGAAR